MLETNHFYQILPDMEMYVGSCCFKGPDEYDNGRICCLNDGDIFFVFETNLLEVNYATGFGHLPIKGLALYLKVLIPEGIGWVCIDDCREPPSLDEPDFWLFIDSLISKI